MQPNNFKLNNIIKFNFNLYRQNPLLKTYYNSHIKYTKPWKIIEIENAEVFKVKSLLDNSIISIHYSNMKLDNNYIRKLKIQKLND